jgi:hypothetical protein
MHLKWDAFNFRGTDDASQRGQAAGRVAERTPAPADKAFSRRVSVMPLVTLMISVKMICTMNILRRG